MARESDPPPRLEIDRPLPFPQAVARGGVGDVDVASGQFVSVLKNVALFGALLMISSYESELSKYRPTEAAAAVSGWSASRLSASAFSQVPLASTRMRYPDSVIHICAFPCCVPREKRRRRRNEGEDATKVISQFHCTTLDASVYLFLIRTHHTAIARTAIARAS